jgi:NADH-quinone oxidoreductase subunit J
LNAQFVGLAQLLVYIGAVAILIVFAVLVTRSGRTGSASSWARGWLAGVAIAAGMAIALVAALSGSRAVQDGQRAGFEADVGRIGHELMGRYVLPLEIAGVLLTAAMIAAVILAMPSREKGETPHE